MEAPATPKSTDLLSSPCLLLWLEVKLQFFGGKGKVVKAKELQPPKLCPQPPGTPSPAYSPTFLPWPYIAKLKIAADLKAQSLHTPGP